MRATAQNVTYELEFNDFDDKNDQIIMDIRSWDDIRLRDLKLKPCSACREIDLLSKFGRSSIRMNYNRRDSYYDVIFDFQRNAALFDHSVFAGNETAT